MSMNGNFLHYRRDFIDDQIASGITDQTVVNLYERAFADFQCAELWAPYLRLLERLCDEGAVDTKVLVSAFSMALKCIGMHMIEGPEVWRLFHEYLKDELQDLQETDAEQCKQAALRTSIHKLYASQLSLPLFENSAVLEEVKEQVLDEESCRSISLAHEKAQKMVEERMKHEDAVVKVRVEADPAAPASVVNKSSIPSAWVDYINLELSKGELVRAKFLFERALSEGWYVIPDLWSWYSDLLITKLASIVSEKFVMRRAVRSVPTSAELWVRMMQSLERVGADYDDVHAVMMNAEQLIRPKDDSLKVAVALCDTSRRLVSNETSSSYGEVFFRKSLQCMRHAFRHAEIVALNVERSPNEEWMNIVEYKARTEASFEPYSGGISPMYDWERLVDRCGNMAKAWLAYTKWYQGRIYEDESFISCKKLFVRALTCTTDDPESICEAFLLFVAQQGTLSHLAFTRHMVHQKRREMMLDPRYKEQTIYGKRPRATSEEGMINRVGGKESIANGSAAPMKKIHKRRRRSEDVTKTTVKKCIRSTIYVSNLAEGVTEDNLREAFQSCGAIHAVHIAQHKKADEHRRTGLVQFVDPGPVPAAIRLSGTDINGQKIKVCYSKFAIDQEAVAVDKTQEQQPRLSEEGESDSTHETKLHETTVFVAGLAKTVNDDTLKQAFLSCGPIKAVHIALDKKRKSKGFGLVQFEDPSALEDAKHLSGTTLEGKVITVKPSKYPAESERDRIIREAKSKPVTLLRPRAFLLNHDNHSN